jgi:SAM-dependent methyltransferase/DNA-directed RNA polymerase subunit RPC12/RpoP
MQAVGAAVTAGRPSVARQDSVAISKSSLEIELRCVTCGTALLALPYDCLAQAREPIKCPGCSSVMAQELGIWLALPPERQGHFAQFLREYETVRKAEGRGSEDPEFYLSLPYQDRTQRNSWQWAIRARTYKHFQQQILPSLTSASASRLTILDLGAGNGWLSYRLAALGHRPIAVDLQTNAYDGLGAGIHYRNALPTLFPRFQAELDRLPFGDAQFDCAIFNASFHYSENYDTTLCEAIRCLRSGGTIIIADTPSYSGEESGWHMLEERRSLFQSRYGFKSDGLASQEYLSGERLVALEARHAIEWQVHNVWYGVRWACRPLVARLKGRREPSQFRVYTAQVKTP